jgi:hypothetical protein
LNDNPAPYNNPPHNYNPEDLNNPPDQDLSHSPA